MKKSIVSLIAMGLTLVVLIVIQAIVANSVSTVGVDVSSMQTEILAYKKENAILKEKLLTASSLTGISEKMDDQGYETASSQLSLSQSLPLARR